MRRIRKVYLQNAAGDRWGLNGENGVYVSSLAGFGYTLSPTYADLTRGFFLAVSGESEPALFGICEATTQPRPNTV